MTVFSFKTIESEAEGIYKEKGSRFLAFAFPVSNEIEIKERLATLQKKYFDARHHCFAWVLGADKSRHRAYDGGEPNHSAGDPILGQIRSRDLTDVLVVVVRYFGGVKLGVGGLVSAYKSAAEDALNRTTIVEKEVKELLTLQYPYESTPNVMRLVKDFDLTITDQTFTTECCLVVQVRIRNREALLEKINLLAVTGTAITVANE